MPYGQVKYNFLIPQKNNNEEEYKRNAVLVLNVVDVFSRKAQSIKLKDKSKQSIKEGLKFMFRIFGSKPQHIWTDKEGAMYSNESLAFFKEEGINVYSKKNIYKGDYGAPIVERFNRTFRSYYDKFAGNGGNVDEKVNHTIVKVNRDYNKMIIIL